jgi:alanyl-tRNA synthetase
MVTKADLLKPEVFALRWFRENRLIRQTCKKCGAGFWSLVPGETCGEPPCAPYAFIGNPVIPKKYDWKALREAYLRWFERNGHQIISRYPVVCRWKPDTLYTGASIYPFMPWVFTREAEPPANPLVLSQPSFRADDLDNIGLGTARHMSIFEMMAHHAFNYPERTIYWKDRTVELCWRWLTEGVRIKPEMITFKEDVWEGGGYAGPCFEVLAGGNELATLVFMEYAGPVNGGYKPIQIKCVDTGYGLERHVWASTGTPTIYNSVYELIIEWLEKCVPVREIDPEIFYHFCQTAGMLNVKEVNVDTSRRSLVRQLAERFGVDPAELLAKIMSYHAIYQIADHTRAIMFILGDGVVPSNVQEGYLARLLIRRSLRNLADLGLERIPLSAVVERQLRHHRDVYPEFWADKENILHMVDVEAEKYTATLKRGREIVRRIDDELRKAGKERIDRQTLIRLYESQGLLPRDVKRFSKMPLADISDLDTRMAVSKSIVKVPVEKLLIDITGLPETKLLFYEQEKLHDFTAKVLRIVDGKYVVLDRTAFYPRGGGQEPDHGSMDGCTVYDVERVGGVVVHEVEEPAFNVGDTVKCKVNATRRKQITAHHTATHIINGAARRLLGSHVWQAGSKKDIDKAHLDITHYAPLTSEQIEQIERLANDIVKKNIKIVKQFMPRSIAEKKFGFRLYQGGAVPGKLLRIVDITGFDTEACGGTHCDGTAEVGLITITKAERVQDGIIRLIYAAGPAAIRHLREREEILHRCARALDVSEARLPDAVRKLFIRWKDVRKSLQKLEKEIAEKKVRELKFTKVNGLRILVADILGARPEQLKEISRKLSRDNTVIFLLGVADKIYVFASVGPTSIKAGINAATLVRDACVALGGSGGGLPGLAQGVGTRKDKVREVVDSVRYHLKVSR